MAKLIRYTVVNPNRHLIEIAPEGAIIYKGICMMRGDEKGFLMDLAMDLKGALQEHNEYLKLHTYEDAEGKVKQFKPVKLSDLDVVVEVLKEYKA